MVEAFSELEVTKSVKITPQERLLIDVVRILGPVSSSARLSDILFIAQECGAIVGDETETYEFSPFGAYPYRPVSGNLEYSVVMRLKGNDVFVRGEDTIIGHWGEEALPDEELASPIGAVRNPRVLKQIAQIDPSRLINMAGVVFFDNVCEEREKVLERAKNPHFV